MARDLRIAGDTLVEWHNGGGQVVGKITCNEGNSLIFSVRHPDTGEFVNFKMIDVNGNHGFPS